MMSYEEEFYQFCQNVFADSICELNSTADQSSFRASEIIPLDLTGY